MAIDDTLNQLRAEIESLKSRAVITDEMMRHLLEIYSDTFAFGIYDADNEEMKLLGHRIWPHITALNDALHFKK